MKINVTQELSRNTLLSHIILNGLTRAIGDSIGEKTKPFKTEDGIVMDVVITAGGIELDLQEFCDHWQSQVGEFISEQAKKIIADKFSDITDLLYDLEGRIKPEIAGRLEDWEKE